MARKKGKDVKKGDRIDGREVVKEPTVHDGAFGIEVHVVFQTPEGEVGGLAFRADDEMEVDDV